ncbi:MAG: transglutaminase domain-containing protein, partial [Planctomycetota bacterium]
YYIAMVILALYAISTIDILFSFFLFFFLFISPWIFLTFQLFRHLDHNPLKEKEVSLSLKSSFTFLALSLVLSLLLTSFLFLFIPRSDAMNIRGRKGGTSFLSGFSEKVDLDDLGYILENPNVVMRIKMKSPFPPGFIPLLKGTTFEIYNSKKWYQTRQFYRLAKKKGSFTLATFPKKSRTFEYEIYQLPMNSSILFTLYNISSLSINDPRFQLLFYSPQQWIKAPREIRIPITYRCISYIPELWLNKAFLQKSTSSSRNTLTFPFPKELSKERFRRFAIEKIGLSSDLCPYEKAKKIEEYLKKNFEYTLDLSSSPQKDPVEDFLFYRKKGHCELFASSMVFLLRSLDLPARLVNGFRLVEWNDLGHYYIVRQKHAHAWVEMYLDQIGWIPFDPTASRMDMMEDSSGRLGNLWDYLNMEWNNRIVIFDREKQWEIYHGIALTLRHWKEGFLKFTQKGWKKERLWEKSHLLFWLVFIIVIGGGFLLGVGRIRKIIN